MKKKVILVIVLLVATMLIIISCGKKNAVGPDNANLPEVNLPTSFGHQVLPESTGTVEPVDTVKPPVLFGVYPNQYDQFPSGWKFPFSGSWQISVGYNGTRCSGGIDYYHTVKEKYAIDWNLAGESDNGKPVLAPASGWVMYADPRGCWGNTAVVNAGNGYYYRVAHLSRIDVKAGWWVPRGYQLGLAGNSGCADGSHIHFSVYYPASYGGNGYVNGYTIPQNGISGQWDLRVCSWYSSGQ